MARRAVLSRRSGAGRGQAAVCDPDPAAQRDGRAPSRTRPQQHAAGRARPPQADAGLRHAVDARHRPRRHRHADRRREAAAARRHPQAGSRPRALHRTRAGVEGRVRGDDHRAAREPRLLLRLRAHPLHDGPGLHRRGAGRVLPPLRRRPHLPGQAARQLGSSDADGPRRRRGRDAHRRRAHALHQVPARGWVGLRRRRDDTSGDDARRHRGRGEPQGSPRRVAAWQARAASDRRSRHPNRRGRLRGDARVAWRRVERSEGRLRDGLPQGHARARRQRLGDRAPPRSRGGQRARPPMARSPIATAGATSPTTRDRSSGSRARTPARR